MAASENMHKGEIDALTRLAEEIRTVEVLASLADDPEHRAYTQYLAGQFRDMLDQLTTQRISWEFRRHGGSIGKPGVKQNSRCYNQNQKPDRGLLVQKFNCDGELCIG